MESTDLSSADEQSDDELDESLLNQIILERSDRHPNDDDDGDGDGEEVAEHGATTSSEREGETASRRIDYDDQARLEVEAKVTSSQLTGSSSSSLADMKRMKQDTLTPAQERPSSSTMPGQRAGAYSVAPGEEDARRRSARHEILGIRGNSNQQDTPDDDLEANHDAGSGVGGCSGVSGEGCLRSSRSSFTTTTMGSSGYYSSSQDLASQQRQQQGQADNLPIAAEVVDDHFDCSSTVAATASVVDDTAKRNKKKIIIVVALVVLAAAIVGAFFAGRRDNNNSNTLSSATHLPPTDPTVETVEAKNLTTLQAVKARGVLRCGMYANYLGFSHISDNGRTATGLNWDLCRAVAAVVLDDPDAVEAVAATAETRFVKLENREVDFLAMVTSHNMGRDAWEEHVNKGCTFSVPHAYVGLAFAGVPMYVDCAQGLEIFNENCRNMVVCIRQGTTYVNSLEKLFPGPEKWVTKSHAENFQALENGECNVVADASAILSESAARKFGYTGIYKLGDKLFSKEPLTLVTRDDDPEWSNLVNLVMKALYTADAHNMTQSSAFDNLALFNGIEDVDFKSVIVKSVSAVGNIDELYQKHLSDVVPRTGLNSFNDGSSGLIFSLPFGKLETQGQIRPGGVIESITDRGYLRCGVTKKPGFAESSDTDGGETWTGFDVDFCRGVAAALFPGDSNGVEYIEIPNSSDRFRKLAQGEVDVLAGERVSLLNGYREPTTGLGYSFSPPYFYENDSDNAYAFATRQEDPQFSDLVYWLVIATFYAAEKGISHETAHEMPLVRLFGEGCKGIFVDCIYQVGNYGDMYNRSLEALIPRTGRNNLNLDMGPQQFAFPFV